MTEETFVRELERRADEVHGAPFGFEDVRRTAVRIRRRRRAAAAGAVAAAVAVAAIVPSVLMGGDAKRSRAPEPAPSPAGHAAVLHDGVVTQPDGSSTPIDVDNVDVTQFGVLTDGRVVVALQQPYSVRVYLPSGGLQSEFDVASNALTTSPDDELVAWVGEDFRIQVLESGVPEPATLEGIPMAGESAGSIDAILGRDCAHGGCKALVGDGNTTTGESTASSHANLTTPEPMRVTDVSPDGALWAVTLPRPDADPQFGCSGLYDPASHRLVAENCDTSLLAFSPDGEHLTGARGDNRMWGEVDVFDLDLQKVATLSPGDGRVVTSWAWTDETHVVAATTDLAGSDWSLERMPLGGEPEVIQGPVSGRSPEMVSEYLLSD